MIDLKNIKKTYDGNVVLNIPSLTIPEGENFGLVGNNGAGKTTMFSLLLDLIKATEGEILSKNINVATSEDWKHYTGAFVDEGFLIDFLTPIEYFTFTGKLYGLTKADIDEFLIPFTDFFNDEILGNKKYIRDLSKGNQKKVGIVGALIGNPEILILDEPFANLDPTSQSRLKKLINDLRAEKTILISSHDLNHVTEVCNRIVVVEKGEVVKDLETNPETLTELEAYFAV